MLWPDIKLPSIKQFWQFILSTIDRFGRHGCMNSAAALTYTTLFAVVPLMTVTYSLLSAIPSFQGMGETIQTFIFHNFVPTAGEAVKSYLVNFSQQARKLTAVGILFLIVTAFMMLRTVDKAINKIWQVDQMRRGVSGFLLYWAILSLGPFMVGLGLVVTSYLASLKFVTDTTAYFGVEHELLRLMPVLLSGVVLTLLYAAVPNRKVPVRHALMGALVVAIALETAKGLFTLFVTRTPTYELVYGAFAAVPVFLLWIYLSWVLVLFGAVLVRNLGLTSRYPDSQRWPPLLMLMVVLHVFREQFQRGRPVNLKTFQKQGWPLSLEDWENHSGCLLNQGIICKNSNGELVLGRDLRELSLAEFCQQQSWPIPDQAQLTRIETDGRPQWFAELLNRLGQVNEAKTTILDINLDRLYKKTS